MQRRHVVLVANTGWNIIRFRAELMTGLLDAGWTVSAVASFNGDHLDRLRRLGVRPIPVELDAAGRNPVRDLAYLGRLTYRIRQLRPDLVHLFTIKPVIWGTFAARLAGVPGIVASHRATLIAGSGIDTEALVPDLSRRPAERKAFVMASRMLWSKGVADFVAAARLVKQHHPAAQFVLFGGAREDYGSKNPDFIERSWLEALNREGAVEWCGWTDPVEVEAAMRAAAAVILPSYYREGVPRALIEAAAAGVPVITTDLPGCRDTVIDGGSGFLVPPRAPERLAAAMAELLLDPERIAAMGREARRLAGATLH